MLSKLLILSLSANIIGFKNVSIEEYNFHYFIILTHILCIINLFIRNKSFQLLLHDSLIYILTFGLVGSMRIYTKIISIIFSIVLLSTRFYYKRCIFLYWKTTRSIDFDIIVFGMVFFCLFRTFSLLGHKECILIGIISHFFDDDSYIRRLLK